MRFDIAKDGSGLVYEIRQIVAVAKKMEEYGIERPARGSLHRPSPVGFDGVSD